MVAEAEILILDEPTSALDLKNQAWCSTGSARCRARMDLTVVLTTHHPHHALAVADDAFLMLGETQYVTGPASQALTEENLTKLYGSAMKRVTFEHEGRSVETLTPILPMFARAQREQSPSAKLAAS